jgi:MoaA/NifB/PqqE/SkfB family radical SAM enzyme
MQVEKKLEITRRLEARAAPNGNFKNRLRGTFSILNLPAPFHCGRACKGCINRQPGARKTLEEENRGALSPQQTKDIISLFAEKYGTLFITVNGRGDPFHPKVAEETLEKISHANSLGMQAYVFTAGDNLDARTSRFLAESGTNVMISLFGNQFLGAEFFDGEAYSRRDAKVAANLRTLIAEYMSSSNQPEDGITRIGMNYVLGPDDADDHTRLARLKLAANQNGIFFICNRDFDTGAHAEHNGVLTALARAYSDFGLPHSTFADGVCQMGAGSSITIAANGDVYRCPYMLEGSDGNVLSMGEDGITLLFARYLANREYCCIVRKTEIETPKGRT